MCENDIKKGDMSSAEIKSLRQTIADQITGEVMAGVQASMQKTTQETKVCNSPVKDKEKNNVKQYHWYLLSIPLFVLAYGFLIGYIVRKVFTLPAGHNPQMCNNVSVILISVLILSTLVLVCLSRYVLVMHKDSIEATLKYNDNNKQNKKEEKSLKDQMMEKAQAAILEIVVKDTIDSFKRK